MRICSAGSMNLVVMVTSCNNNNIKKEVGVAYSLSSLSFITCILHDKKHWLVLNVL